MLKIIKPKKKKIILKKKKNIFLAKKFYVKSKDFLLKKIKTFNKQLIQLNIILKEPIEKKKKRSLYKKINQIDMTSYKFKYKLKTHKRYKTFKRKRYFNTRLALKQYKNNFYAVFSLRNVMRRYYSTGLFFNSGPKKSSTYAAQLVGKLMGRFIKRTLRRYRFKLKIRNLCLSLRTRRNAFTYSCLKGIFRSRIWFNVYDPCRKIPHGYIRLRKPRSL